MKSVAKIILPSYGICKAQKKLQAKFNKFGVKNKSYGFKYTRNETEVIYFYLFLPG